MKTHAFLDRRRWTFDDNILVMLEPFMERLSSSSASLWLTRNRLRFLGFFPLAKRSLSILRPVISNGRTVTQGRLPPDLRFANGAYAGDLYYTSTDKGFG